MSALPGVTGLVTLVHSTGLHFKQWSELNRRCGCSAWPTIHESSFILTCKFYYKNLQHEFVEGGFRQTSLSRRANEKVWGAGGGEGVVIWGFGWPVCKGMAPAEPWSPVNEWKSRLFGVGALFSPKVRGLTLLTFSVLLCRERVLRGGCVLHLPEGHAD